MSALGTPSVAEIFSSMEEGPSVTAPGPGEVWLETQGRALGNFVSGNWLKPLARGHWELQEVATGRLLATIPPGEVADVAVALEAATAAAEEWRGLGGAQRAQRLRSLAQRLEEGAPTLGSLAALGEGRPLTQTLTSDLPRGLRLLREAAAAGALLGPSCSNRGDPHHGVVVLVLGGPCGLGPLLGALGALLALGNGVLILVWAPPVEVALVPLLVAELGGGALPTGLLSVITGTPQLLPPHIPVTLLGTPQGFPPALGGGSWGGRIVVIVLEGADLDSAAVALGEALGTPSALLPWGGLVVLAQEGLLPTLQQRLQLRLERLQVGDPQDPKTQLGPLPPHCSLRSLEELLQVAREEGAEIFQPPVPLGGQFYPPTLISGVTPTSRCLRELAGGPLLPLLPFRCSPEALALTLTLPGVTAASLWTQDLTLALGLADRLPLGLVWLNSLDPLDPLVGGYEGGAGTSLEALHPFSCSPWAPPQGLGAPLEPASLKPAVTPDLVAVAVEEARKATKSWGAQSGPSRSSVLRRAAATLGAAQEEENEEEGSGSLQKLLLRWAERVELMGGAIKEVPGGRLLVRRRPLGVVGVAWSGPHPLPGVLQLLPPLLALGNCVVLLAPAPRLCWAQQLRQALVAAGLPEGALSVLPGVSEDAGRVLAQTHPEWLVLCGGGPLPPLTPGAACPHLWIPELGGRGRILEAERELELRCSLPRCLWVPTSDL